MAQIVVASLHSDQFSLFIQETVYLISFDDPSLINDPTYFSVEKKKRKKWPNSSWLKNKEQPNSSAEKRAAKFFFQDCL